MKKDIALQRYLERHIEPGLFDAPPGQDRWHHALVVPVYDESPDFLQSLKQLGTGENILVVLVLNRPDSNPDTDCNWGMKNAIGQLNRYSADISLPLYRLGDCVDILCLDLETANGPNPAAQGVGLARKAGCDLALLWQAQGAITSEWICSTDADAILPSDYFSRLDDARDSVAAVFPFFHSPGSCAEINLATALYELKLHQYVLGLGYAQSPYTYHTLGSCIAIKRLHYAQVRGYPKRSGGEDFYLLNKLAKLGPIASLKGQCISIAARASQRVPFGTGPAIDKIISGKQSRIFYHPDCFEALRAVLAGAPQLCDCTASDLAQLLATNGLSVELSRATSNILAAQGIFQAIAHCRQHGKTEAQFLRHFHQWFDGFRTLKFIHAIRDNAGPMLKLPELASHNIEWFPARSKNPEVLLPVIREIFCWTIAPPTSATRHSTLLSTK